MMLFVHAAVADEEVVVVIEAAVVVVGAAVGDGPLLEHALTNRAASRTPAANHTLVALRSMTSPSRCASWRP
jgi:hypothetical protein